MKDDKPESFAEALDIIIGYLDLGDKAFKKLAALQGKDLNIGNKVQTDLANLKNNLTPQLDTLLYNLTFGDAIN